MLIRRRQAGEPYRLWDRIFLGFAKTRIGSWYAINVGGRIDPHLVRLTRGKFSLGIGQPVVLLHTVGARSGEPRSTAVLYIRDGDDLVIAATKGGSPKHPAWYHNITAAGEIEIELLGKREPRVVRETEGAERDRLWQKLNTLYKGYDTYQERASERTIPVIVLSPPN